MSRMTVTCLTYDFSTFDTPHAGIRFSNSTARDAVKVNIRSAINPFAGFDSLPFFRHRC